MTRAPQPTSGSLSARLVRACLKHNNKCALNCPRRKIEDLGEIASFRAPQPAAGPGLLSRLKRLFSPKGDPDGESGS